MDSSSLPLSLGTGGVLENAMPVSSRSPSQHRFSPKRTAARRGFTLVEAMVATVVFSMVTLGVYATLIKSYQLAALTRARDDARAVLRTYADQFQRLQTTHLVGSNPGTVYNRWLFNPTSGDSGRGLSWGVLNDADTSTNAVDVPYLSITLGGTGNSYSLPATLTRNVRYVNTATGNVSGTQAIEAAGFMLVGTFKVNFSMNGMPFTQSMTVIRATP